MYREGYLPDYVLPCTPSFLSCVQVKERKKYAKKQLGTDHVEEDDPEKVT